MKFGEGIFCITRNSQILLDKKLEFCIPSRFYSSEQSLNCWKYLSNPVKDNIVTESWAKN